MSSTAVAPRARPGAGHSALVLVAFLAINAGVAALGSVATIENVDGWYAAADKASWTPPSAVFGPVWTLLYALMAVAAWLVWREVGAPGRRRALAAYVIQLVLNAIWTPVFFGLYPVAGAGALWIALVVIVALDAAVLVMMLRFWRVRHVAAWLLAPYWAWLLYAATLNAAIAALAR